MAGTVKPTPKVQAGGYVGAAALALIWTLGQFGIDMPAEVAGGFVLLAFGAAAWIKRDASSPGGRHAAE